MTDSRLLEIAILIASRKAQLPERADYDLLLALEQLYNEVQRLRKLQPVKEKA